MYYSNPTIIIIISYNYYSCSSSTKGRDKRTLSAVTLVDNLMNVPEVTRERVLTRDKKV